MRMDQAGKIFFGAAAGSMWSQPGRCQDAARLLGEASLAYGVNAVGSGQGAIGGFSLAGLLGSVLFGGIGFIAFAYGKKNHEFRPMIIGIALMAYPFFLKDATALYLVGAALTAGLWLWRE